MPDFAEEERSVCDKCCRDNPVWFAPNRLWNTVMGDETGIVCPICFMQIAEAAGIEPTAWVVDVEHHPIPEARFELDRTAAVLQVLTQSRTALSPTDITERLHQQGRDDGYAAVSATLAHLQRTSRIHSLGRGKWVFTEIPQDSTPTDAIIGGSSRPLIPDSPQ